MLTQQSIRDKEFVEKMRVNCYIDGFNLYHGVHGEYGRKYLWLDVRAMLQSLLGPTESLGRV
jgi:hypothetical protein